MSSNRTRPPLKPGGSAGSSGGSSGGAKGGSSGGSSGGAKGGGTGGSGSAERPRSSRSNNPSSRGDNYHGFAATSQNLRPVTHDKVGYPLLCYLNHKDWTAVFPEFTLADLNRPDDGGRHWHRADALLHSKYQNWIKEAQKEGKDPHERKLTEVIAKGMKRALRASPTGNITEVLYEHSVKTRTPDMSGLVDVIAFGSEGTPVLLVEVGLLSDDWWKKLDQGLMYAPGLEKFDQPILFVVLTVNVIKDDPRKIEGGRMGVFLVTPRNDFHKDAHYLCKFRMSLLRRVQTESLTELSEAFGRVLRAAYVLPGWNSNAESSYRYLGPSCCRVTFSEVREPCACNCTFGRGCAERVPLFPLFLTWSLSPRSAPLRSAGGYSSRSSRVRQSIHAYRPST
jgi:hypothetical protein